MLDRIEGWAALAPERVAFRAQGQSLTYGELLSRAHALAAWLARELGDNFAPVAIHGHKEPGMLVGFLGAVLSGRAYVPIDRSYPSHRVESIVRRAGAAICLTPGRIAEIGLAPSTPARVRLRPEDPFYILFTSGSTGEPKGVVITLANLTHFVDALSAELALTAEPEVFLNQASFSFDLSVMDLYLSLVTGGTLFSVTREQAVDLPRLPDLLAGSGITTWVSTPSFARLCLVGDAFAAVALPQLRRFLFCGEILPPQTARELLRRFPAAEVWNTYGPTETTVATTAIRVDLPLLDAHPSLPIGRPLPGTRVLLLDAAGQAVAEGERGEIVIAGPNVSPGYLGQPDQTATAFVRVENLPAYRTGDWGRARAGLLFFEGRSDSQVKVNGHRVELGDIEANLRALPEIADAIVLLAPGDSLAAFLISRNGHRPGSAELRSLLEDRLPAYMVPRRFQFLEAFPLTPNGKADRAQLAHGAAVSAPETPAILTGREQQVAAVWGRALGLGQVSPQQNFFELGGDSVCAAQVLLELEALYGIELPVTLLYRYPTVAQLVGALERNLLLDRPQALIPILEGQSGPALFWLPGATASERVLLGHAPHIARLARALSPGHAVYSIYREYPTPAAPLTLEQIAAGLVDEIRAAQPHGPYYLAGWSFGGFVAYEMARQLQQLGETVALLALLDATAPGSPRPRPWRRRPAALWRHWQGLPASHRFSRSCRELWSYLGRQLTEGRRRLGLSVAGPSLWARTMQLEAGYFSSPRPYSGPLLILACEETLALTQDRISVVHDPSLGWSNLAASVETREIPGDHHTMFDEPGLSRIAREIDSRLNRS